MVKIESPRLNIAISKNVYSLFGCHIRPLSAIKKIRGINTLTTSNPSCHPEKPQQPVDKPPTAYHARALQCSLPPFREPVNTPPAKGDL